MYPLTIPFNLFFSSSYICTGVILLNTWLFTLTSARSPVDTLLTFLSTLILKVPCVSPGGTPSNETFMTSSADPTVIRSPIAIEPVKLVGSSTVCFIKKSVDVGFTELPLVRNSNPLSEYPGVSSVPA